VLADQYESEGAIAPKLAEFEAYLATKVPRAVEETAAAIVGR